MRSADPARAASPCGPRSRLETAPALSSSSISRIQTPNGLQRRGSGQKSTPLQSNVRRDLLLPCTSSVFSDRSIVIGEVALNN